MNVNNILDDEQNLKQNIEHKFNINNDIKFNKKNIKVKNLFNINTNIINESKNILKTNNNDKYADKIILLNSKISRKKINTINDISKLDTETTDLILNILLNENLKTKESDSLYNNNILYKKIKALNHVNDILFTMIFKSEYYNNSSADFKNIIKKKLNTEKKKFLNQLLFNINK